MCGFPPPSILRRGLWPSGCGRVRRVTGVEDVIYLEIWHLGSLLKAADEGFHVVRPH